MGSTDRPIGPTIHAQTWSARFVSLLLVFIVAFSSGGEVEGQEPNRFCPAPDPRNSPEPRQQNAGVVAKPAAFDPRQFERVQATDKTFSICVPKGWTVRRADFQNGITIWSPRGEMVFQHFICIPGTVEALRTRLQGMEFIEQIQGKHLSPEKRELMSRFLSPPLSPVPALRDLVPKINAPVVQNLRVLDTRKPSDAMRKLYAMLRAESALMHYTYTFHGAQGNELQRSMFPRALAMQKAVEMEGQAFVATTPPLLDLSPLPGLGRDFPELNNWGLVLIGAEGPADVFAANQLIYDVIFGSVQIDWQALGKVIEQQNNVLIATGKMVDRQNKAMLDSTRAMSAGMELLGREIIGTPAYYAEGEQQIYILPDEPSGRTVVSPSGEVLRPATIDDLLRFTP
jgi:hypothetical protein